MSKPYKISIRDLLTAEDSSTFQIQPIPIVQRERFAQILTEILENDGWEKDLEGRPTFSPEKGKLYTFEPDNLQFSVKLEATEKIEEEIEGWNPRELREEAERELSRRQRELEKKLSLQLEAEKEERHRLFESLIARATGKALKELAQSIGNIESIEESFSENGEYRLVITIEENE